MTAKQRHFDGKTLKYVRQCWIRAPVLSPLTLTSTLARVILSRVELPKRESVAPTRAPGTGSRAAEFDRWLRGKKRLAAFSRFLGRFLAGLIVPRPARGD